MKLFKFFLWAMLVAAPFEFSFGEESVDDKLTTSSSDVQSDKEFNDEELKKNLTTLRTTSESLYVKEGTGEIVFKGSVAAVALTSNDDVLLDEQTSAIGETEEFLLCTDLLTVNLTTGDKGDKKNIESVSAVGSVIVVQSNRIIRGANALYDRSSALVRVLGNARIEECSNVVEGTEIVLDITDDTARVEGGMTATVRTLIGVEANNCVIDDFFKLKSGELSGGDICTKFKKEL